MGSDKRKFGIYQIELTNFCNMCCTYCPHPSMTRKKGHMSAETLARCIALGKSLGKKGLVVHHFGDPLMHPQLRDRLQQIADAGLTIQFSTNGVLLEDALPMLQSINTTILITLSAHQWSNHHPNIYMKVLENWKEKTKGSNVSVHKAFNITESKLHLHKWTSGKENNTYRDHCFFLRENLGVVLWNGDIVTCCTDCHGESVVDNIHRDDSAYAQLLPWRGCQNCDLFR